MNVLRIYKDEISDRQFDDIIDAADEVRIFLDQMDDGEDDAFAAFRDHIERALNSNNYASPENSPEIENS